MQIQGTTSKKSVRKRTKCVHYNKQLLLQKDAHKILVICISFVTFPSFWKSP
jgi:hypothetical protein